jgi:hypothetical protein
MPEIGYTWILSDNSLLEVQIIGKHKGTKDYIFYKAIPEKATYKTNKCKAICAYDIYGNKIEDENNMAFQLCSKQFIYEYEYEEEKHIPFVFDFNVALNKLREKTFFEKNHETYGMDTDSEDEFSYPHVNPYNLYVKKDNIDINFSGIQYIYNTYGYIDIEFYHVNGKKEGIYKVSNTIGKYNLEITYCDDVKIKFEKIRKDRKDKKNENNYFI